MNKVLEAIAANPVESVIAITFLLTVLINLWTAARAGEWSRFRELLLALGPDIYRAAKIFKTTPEIASAKSRASFQLDALAEAGLMPRDIIIESVDKAGNTSQSIAPPPELPKATKVPPLPVIFLLAICGLGCGATEKVIHTIQLSSVALAASSPCLNATFEAQMSACVDPPAPLEDAEECMARVKKIWDPIVEAFTQLRETRCAIEPAKCADQGAIQ